METSISETGEGRGSAIVGSARYHIIRGLILVIVVGASSAGNILAQSDGYWFLREGMPEARQEVLPVVLDGRVWVLGGWLDNGAISSAFDVFDPQTNSWSSAAPYPFLIHHVATAEYDGLLYTISGYVTAPLPWATTSAVYVYDPVADSWTARADIPTERGEHCAVTFEDKIYVIGGNDSSGADCSIVDVYDPATDSWTTVSPMPTARHHPAVAVVDSLIYVAGGRTGYWNAELTMVPALEAYSPASDTWYVLPDMPTARSAASAAALEGKLYVMGGENPGCGVGLCVFEQVAEYDPLTSTWRQMTPMLTPRHGTGAALVGDTVFVIGGAYREGLEPSDATDGFLLGHCSDSDHDGFGSAGDPENTCPPDNCFLYNPDQADGDLDGVGDLCDGCPADPGKIVPGVCGCGVADTDSDSDGVPDCDDICAGYDDYTDVDIDGVPDSCDNCPGEWNPNQADTNSNQIGDVCDGCCLPPTVGDVDQSGIVDISDISVLIDNQFLTLTPLLCEPEGDVDFSGVVDISDLSVLIDNQFLTLTPLEPCP